jgi:hypothetical protein
VSYQDVWLHHPGIRSIFTRLINMTDALSIEERKRAVQFRITPKTVPMLWNPPQPGEDAYLWKLIQRLDQEGYVRLKLGKMGPGQAEYESKPMLALNPEREADIREIIGRPDRPGADVERWRQALQVHAHSFPGSIEKLFFAPIRIPGKSHGEIVERLALLLTIPTNLYLREVSARLFWGLSKVLDGREEEIATLLGLDQCPFIEKPVILHVHAPNPGAAHVRSIVFIENETTYLAAFAGRYPFLAGHILVYASGYKASAERLCYPLGRAVHSSTVSRMDGVLEFLAWLDGENDVPAFFWGDLDYAGLGILKALRDIFTGLTAYTPGYSPMVEMLKRGEGHECASGAKEGQVDPGETGCPYADAVLLPLVREIGLFVDQEAV